MKEMNQLLRDAHAGDAQACFLVACAYERTKKLEDASEQAFYWMRQAARKKHLQAQTNLGCYYERGYGVAKDIKKAFVWWKKAAALGSAPAKFNMGLHLFYGDGIRKNQKGALQLLTQAAEAESHRMPPLLFFHSPSSFFPTVFHNPSVFSSRSPLTSYQSNE